MSIDTNNSEKKKWILEYKNLSQNYKNEELDLLKLFLVKNYHLNKVYKKYAYKSNKQYRNEFQKKLDILLNKRKEKNIELKNIIDTIKEESNKEYDILIKEENKIENELKKFDKDAMIIYENDFNGWMKRNKSIILNNSDFDKENSFISINDKFDKKLNYSTNFYSKNYETDVECNKYSEFSSVNQDDKSYNLNNMIESINDKSKCIKLTKLNTQIPKEFNDYKKYSENPINLFLDKITKDINYIYLSKFCSKTMNRFNQINNTPINEKEDEKMMNNSIKIYLNKISENSLYYLNEKIKKINDIIKNELGGINLGWTESEHKEFIKLTKSFKGNINSFLFLSNSNNLFPYMNISKLKKHIKLYEIYLKLEKIKYLLIDKYNAFKILNKMDKNKSFKQYNTSISVTKSFSSYKINNFAVKRNNLKSLDNKRRTKTLNKEKINKMKIKKDYLKINIFRTKEKKENIISKVKKKREYFDNHSLNIIRKRNSNNFFFKKNN